MQRYTEDADKKILADSAARKRIANAKLANLPRPHRQTQGEATENTREGKRYGGPDRTRTCDLRFRKPLLYPAELRDRFEEAILIVRFESASVSNWQAQEDIGSQESIGHKNVGFGEVRTYSSTIFCLLRICIVVKFEIRAFLDCGKNMLAGADASSCG